MKEPVDVESIVSGVYDPPMPNAIFHQSDRDFGLKNLNPIIAVYNAHMNKWTFDRLNRVEQALLLAGLLPIFLRRRETSIKPR
jgi:hypothetical protein